MIVVVKNILAVATATHVSSHFFINTENLVVLLPYTMMPTTSNIKYFEMVLPKNLEKLNELKFFSNF